ncbi:hypothetical protein Tsubulata_003082 [Turnera subulata]|uniref:SKP1 component dimerisation domain-containing protein n=1 Tax=Turnera subulata TaxID=218843 RepID=A0A9Q0JCR2_9ROSI|nr:hypothetical protein Tsubulata_003082 [Turnera subulata]
MILEKHELSEQLRIRNPTLEQVFYIPNPHKRNRVVWFGFAPTSGFYKLVCIYDSDVVGNGYGAEILVLGIEDKPSWKHINNDHLMVCTADGVHHIAKISTTKSWDFLVALANDELQIYIGVARISAGRGDTRVGRRDCRKRLCTGAVNMSRYLMRLKNCVQQTLLYQEIGEIKGSWDIVFDVTHTQHRVNSRMKRCSMSKVIEYCKKHSRSGSTKEAEKELEAWDAEFVKADDYAALMFLMMAANFLDIQGLMDLAAQTLANMMKGKSPEEVRRMFNIKNDFTQEEEAAVRK